MIANDRQFDPQWLNDHGGARRRTRLEVLGAWMRERAPVWRYQMEQSNREAVRTIWGGFLRPEAS